MHRRLAVLGFLLVAGLALPLSSTTVTHAAARHGAPSVQAAFGQVKFMSDGSVVTTFTTEGGLTAELSGNYCVDGSCSADTSCGGS